MIRYFNKKHKYKLINSFQKNKITTNIKIKIDININKTPRISLVFFKDKNEIKVYKK